MEFSKTTFVEKGSDYMTDIMVDKSKALLSHLAGVKPDTLRKMLLGEMLRAESAVQQGLLLPPLPSDLVLMDRVV